MKKRLFIRFFSLFCTLSILFSGVMSHYTHHFLEKNTQRIEQKQEKQSEKTKVSEKLPFDAIVTAGLQVDFQKFVFSPVFIFHFEIPTKIQVAQVFVTLLSYYHVLFRTSIQVNAP